MDYQSWQMTPNSLHEKMKTEFLYTSSCAQGWMWALPWQVLFPGCLSFVAWLYTDVWLIRYRKKLSVSTPQQVELTAPTELEHTEFMNLIATVCQNTRCHIRAKVTFKNLTSGCYIMLIRSLAWIWSCHFSWQPQNICPSSNPVGFQTSFAWNDKDTVIT